MRFGSENVLKSLNEIADYYGELGAWETARGIRNPKLVCIDYARLQKDFPQLRRENLLNANPFLTDLDDNDWEQVLRLIIDHYVLQAAALMSQENCDSTVANTAVDITDIQKRVYRPPRYGRAFVSGLQEIEMEIPGQRKMIKVAAGGAVDLKGVGMPEGRQPVIGDCTDGLLSLRGGLEEYLYEHIIDIVLRDAEADFGTLPYYAIVDPGIQAITGDGLLPACIVVRGAHLRDTFSDLPAYHGQNHYLMFEIEMLLRSYGIYSGRGNTIEIVREHGELAMYILGEKLAASQRILEGLIELHDLEVPFVADRVNIQTDLGEEACAGRQVRIVDFGMFGIRRRFENPVLSLVRDKLLGWGGLYRPEDRFFVQPDEKAAIVCQLSSSMKTRGTSTDLASLVDIADNLTTIYQFSESSHLAVNEAIDDILKAIESWFGSH